VLLCKDIVTSSGSFRSKSLLGDAAAGQGHQQNQYACHLQRASLIPATRRGVHGICQIAQASIPGAIANLQAPGERGNFVPVNYN